MPNTVSRMLPDIPNLVRVCKAIAMLDAILCTDWSLRYYSFNSFWNKDDASEMMASMRDGTGDHYFIWFTRQGAAIKGLAQDSLLNPVHNDGHPFPEIFAQFPAELSYFLKEAAFMIDDTTFCYWRRNCDNEWHSGKIKFPANVGTDPDGSRTMLKILDGKPKTYVDYAREYFDLEIAEEDVKHVYQLKPLNAELLIRLHCERNLDQLSDEIKEIGYIRGT
ncbi:MAG: hypothetical protein EKK48_28670 [Candidatus Melainabacteria bacterium]|nr:MAG: hypothetical protein EKK48_28670 [Candidatus Melainabacteria bacterium]